MSRFEKILAAGFILAAILWGSVLFAGESSYQGSIPDPVQTPLAEPRTVTVSGQEGNVELDLLAEYTIQGVLKGKKKYSDFPSQISAYDYALVWGDLNQKAIDEHIKYSQSGRWTLYRCAPECPVDTEYISTHSANVHLIHQDQEILKKIRHMKKDQYIRLKGYLVNVKFAAGPWKSSLSRTDTGNGACEILYVTEITECK